MAEPEAANHPEQDELDYPTEYLLSARYGDLDDVVAYLDAGVDINSLDENGNNALMMAAANGHCDVIRVLVSRGINCKVKNTNGNTAIHWAAINEQIEENAFGNSPIQEAINKGLTGNIMDVMYEQLSKNVQAARGTQPQDEQNGVDGNTNIEVDVEVEVEQNEFSDGDDNGAAESSASK